MWRRVGAFSPSLDMPLPDRFGVEMVLILVKVALVAAIAVAGILALRGSRRAYHKVIWRSLLLLVMLAGALSVVFPDALTEIANAVGIGRGADLLLYLTVVTFMLVSVSLFRRLSGLERRYVELARQLALRDARLGQPGELGTARTPE